MVHFIVERNMNQTLKLSNSNGYTVEHLLSLPWKNRGSAKEEKATESSKQQRKNESLYCHDPPKPIQANFRAVNLMSSPQKVSCIGQKRE